MSFIRRKVRHGKTYHALVESYREGEKVKQRVLCPLGKSPTFEDAIKREKKSAAFWPDPPEEIKLRREERMRRLKRGQRKLKSEHPVVPQKHPARPFCVTTNSPTETTLRDWWLSVKSYEGKRPRRRPADFRVPSNDELLQGAA